MGVLNVTPDSFSDGGQFMEVERAVVHGVRMVEEGAGIVDVGGESTRPGSEPVPAAEQIRRVVPVIEQLRGRVKVPISIDSYNVEVVRAALGAGAGMVNDITALGDTAVGEVAAEYEVPVVLMHMQGMPATMQIEPKYEDVVGEVLEFLVRRARRAEDLGIPRERIFIDPGIGFGKTVEHNLRLLKEIGRFVATGYRVLVGTSRKSFIGAVTGKDEPKERVYGTAATVAWCVEQGVSVVRVHDVGAMVDVVKMVWAIQGAGGEERRGGLGHRRGRGKGRGGKGGGGGGRG